MIKSIAFVSEVVVVFYRALHNMVTTLLQRRCNVTTLQRRCNDIDVTLCVCWVRAVHKKSIQMVIALDKVHFSPKTYYHI